MAKEMMNSITAAVALGLLLAPANAEIVWDTTYGKSPARRLELGLVNSHADANDENCIVGGYDPDHPTRVYVGGPCSLIADGQPQTGFRWVVMETPLTASAEQIRAFKVLFANPANNRPLQLLNGRTVYKNKETLDRTVHDDTVHDDADDHGHPGTDTGSVEHKYTLAGSGACDSWPWLGVHNGITKSECEIHCNAKPGCIAYTVYSGGQETLSPGKEFEITCEAGCILYDACEKTKVSSCDGLIEAYKREDSAPAQIDSAREKAGFISLGVAITVAFLVMFTSW